MKERNTEKEEGFERGENNEDADEPAPRPLKCVKCGEITHSAAMTHFRCPECKHHGSAYQGRLAYMADSELSAFGTGPKTDAEIDIDVGNLRGYVDRLTVSATRSGPRTGKPTAIYYLPGDERSAVRRFIEENEELVRYCLEEAGTGGGAIKYHWPQYMWQMLEEQWYLEGYHDRS